MLSSPFRNAGICTETSRTWASGKQLVCTLPSANVARTCRTMESPTITASCSVSRRGAKGFRVEISKKGGGGGGEVIARGLARVFSCCCTQGPGFPGARVKDIWEDRVPGARGLCRETHKVEVVGVLAACCILTPNLWASARDVSSVAFRFLSWACFPSSCRSVSPPAPAAPNAAQMCPHLHSKVDTNLPLKQVTLLHWNHCSALSLSYFYNFPWVKPHTCASVYSVMMPDIHPRFLNSLVHSHSHTAHPAHSDACGWLVIWWVAQNISVLERMSQAK